MANWDRISGNDGTVVVVMYVNRKYLHCCWYIYINRAFVVITDKCMEYSLQHNNAENGVFLQSRPIQWIECIWCRLGMDFGFILAKRYVLGNILGLLNGDLVGHGKYWWSCQQLTRESWYLVLSIHTLSTCTLLLGFNAGLNSTPDEDNLSLSVAGVARGGCR